jgi:hypothetical protein
VAFGLLGQESFEYLAEHPAEEAIFNEAMAEATRAVARVRQAGRADRAGLPGGLGADTVAGLDARSRMASVNAPRAIIWIAEGIWLVCARDGDRSRLEQRP